MLAGKEKINPINLFPYIFMVMNGEIKKHICRKRNELKMTQSEVASKIGISLTAYRDLESGKTQMLNDKISRIADAFEISTEELVLGYCPSPAESDRLRKLQEKHELELERLTCAQEEKTKLLEARISDLNLLIEKLEEIIRSKDEIIRTKDDIISFQKKNIGGHD